MATFPRNQVQIIPWLLLITLAAYASAVSLADPPKPSLSRRLLHKFHSARGRKLFTTKSHFYNQTIDHFNYRPESYHQFPQRYQVVDDYWGGAKNSSPIFVYLGSELRIDEDASAGLLYDTAPLFGALILIMEHRYYGLSNPAGWMKKSLKHREIRGYFNSAQALADYAEIILFLKKQYKAHYSPVIVFGPSYGGMLATWLRLKYPHVAMGALASSAPIFMTIVPQNTFDDWVEKVYKDTSKNCYETIKKSWAEMVKLGSEPNGLSLLSQKFNTCSTPKSTESFGYYLVRLYRDKAQFDDPPKYPVSQICSTIDEAAPGTSNLDKVASAVLAVSGGTCYTVSGKDDETALGWQWQSCTELEDPMGTEFDPSNTNSMLPVIPPDLESLIQDCIKDGYMLRPSWIETYYGARDIKLVLKRFGSNIIFSNGLKDPFSQEGVLSNISDTLVAVVVAEGSHGMDLVSADDTDPDWLTAMRKKEVEIMKGWLAVYYADLHAYMSGR